MSIEDDDEVRSVRAVLSWYVGTGLPTGLRGVADACRIDPDGWAFPPAATPTMRADGADIRGAGRLLRRRADTARMKLLVPGDPGWPSGTGCDDLPCLWVSGRTDVAGLLDRAVTVTGSRANSGYGQQVTADLVYGLAAGRFAVVAGAGFGIDATAARAALAAGTPVLLVAGSGLHQPYPAALSQLYQQVAEDGAVVSPFAPGCPPTRNRLTVQRYLLGVLTGTVVIVEASARSRTLVTARAAAQTGRTVCAVPGPVTSATSTPCHTLIAEGTARLVTSSADIIATLAAAHDQ